MARPATIRVWICDNCGNYYGASSAGELDKEWNVEKNSNKPTFRRSRCPTPACAQKDIHRTPITVRIPPAP